MASNQNVIRVYIQNFLLDLDESEETKKSLRIVDLLKDFISLENEYAELGKKIDFLPYFKSLLKQIKGKDFNDMEELNCLYSLHTAVSNKINYISRVFVGTVFQLNDYLENCQKEIESFKKISRENTILERRDMYKNSIEQKMKYANHVIKTDILPYINNIFRNIDAHTETLLQNIAKSSEDTKKQKANKEELKKNDHN